MTRDNDLFELFRSLDADTPTDDPPYADALWAELDQALARQRSSHEAPPSTDAEITEFRPQLDRAETRFPVRTLVGAAAIVAVMLLAVFALPLREPNDLSTDGEVASPPSTFESTSSVPSSTPTTSVAPIPGPRLTVPADACRRYAETEPALFDLFEGASDGGVTAGQIEDATTALLVLQADLVASGEYTDTETRPIDDAVAALGEALLEIEAGLDERVAGSLINAAAAIAELLLPLEPGDSVAPTCLSQGATATGE